MSKQIKPPFEIKGAGIRNLKNYVNQLLGEESFEALAQEVGFANSKLIMPSSWYPAEMFIEMQVSAAKKAGIPLDKFQQESASFIIEHDLLGIYKFFIRVSGSTIVLGKLPLMVSTYTNFIFSETVVNTENEFVMKSTLPAEYHSWYLGNMTGGISSLLKICKRQLHSMKFGENVTLPDANDAIIENSVYVKYE